jgi:hypothetical protein
MNPFDARRAALDDLIAQESTPSQQMPSPTENKGPETIGGALGGVIGGIVGAYTGGPLGAVQGYSAGSQIGKGAGQAIEHPSQALSLASPLASLLRKKPGTDEAAGVTE